MLGVIATQLTTPDTSRAYTVSVGPGRDITGDVQIDSLVMEDQGTNVQATTTFRINGALADFGDVSGQALVEIYDHVSGSSAFRGFIDSHEPARRPALSQIEVIASDHTSLLDNIIPLESRPAGESDAARIGYLWGLYSGSFLNASLAYVQTVQSSMPAQVFASVSLRQALDMIAAQTGNTATFHYLDRAGRLHYGASESNDAPYNVTSDTPGGGEIAPGESLRIDWDSKSYKSRVYVRGKTDAGSGWVYSSAAGLAHRGLQRDTFLDAPDCTTEAMRNALGNMYLGRLNSAKARGSFTVFSTTAVPRDGWRGGQNVTVRSTHLGNINATYRIPRVRTSVLGPATNRRYDVEFGNARAGSDSGTDPVITMGQSITGDLVDDNGALLLSSSPNAFSGGLGPGIRRYITSGVYNGDFALPPVSADSAVNNSWNPLPFWSFTIVSGTSIFVYSKADSAAGSGRSITFDMIAGAAGDDVYLEQIIPINSSQAQSFHYSPRVIFETGSTVSNAQLYLTAQCLKADGETTTGAAQTDIATTTSLGASTQHDFRAPPNFPAPPSDAYFIRIRAGFKRNTAATSTTETVTLHEAWMAWGSTRLFAADETAPTSWAPILISQSNGVGLVGANFSGLSGSTPLITLDGSGTTKKIGFSADALFDYGSTSFPASPATNDLFYRIDLDGWYYYDGTRWLSAEEHHLFCGSTIGLAAGATVAYTPPPDSTTTLWLVKAIVTYYVAPTNNGTNYWTIGLYKYDSAAVSTALATPTSAAESASTIYVEEIAIGAVYDPAAHPTFGFTPTVGAGAPGVLNAGATLVYRTIAT